MRSFSSSPKIKDVIAFLLAISPVFLIAGLIIKFAVPLPIMDDWPMGWFLCKAAEGFFSLKDLIAQSNETRPFFPRLIFLILTAITGWNVFYQMGLTFLLACLISFNIYKICSITIPEFKHTHIFLMIIANLMIFSPLQYQNWLWGIQTIVFIPICCLTFALLICYSNYSTNFKFLSSIFLCTISTYSYANGMICWLLLLPVLIQQNYKAKNLIFLIAIYLLGMTLNITLYFANYIKPPYHPQLNYVLLNPIKAIEYFFCFIGSPIASRYGIKIPLSIFISGILVTIIFMGFACFICHNISNIALLHNALPWFSIAGYSLLSAIMTAIGRSGFGTSLQALDSRYISFSIYLPLSFIFLGAIVYCFEKEKHAWLSKKIRLPLGFLVMIFLIIYFVNISYAINIMGNRRQIYEEGLVYFSLIKIAPNKMLEDIVFPDLAWLRPRALYMRQRNFLPITIIENLNLLEIQDNDPDRIDSCGFMTGIKYLEENIYEVSGNAYLPWRNKPPHAIFLSFKNAEGNQILFRYSTDPFEPVSITGGNKRYHIDSFRKWKIMISNDMIPIEDAEISAWAFDAFAGKVYLLEGIKDIRF